jgi:sn-glycerol 3-phosphate transport system substrate-binding protein
MSLRKGLLLLVCVVTALSAALAVIPIRAQAPAEVKMWIAFTDARLDWAKARAEEFNKQFPQFNVTIQGFEDYEPLLKALDNAVQQKTQLPAVVHVFEVGTQRARDLGLFKPIAEALGDKKELNGLPIDFSDIVGVITNYYTLDGKWTSMPWNTSTPITYANGEMLKAIGLDKPPATWQDLEAACAKLMEKKAELKLDGCFAYPNHGWFMEQWVASQGGLFANNDNGRKARATETMLDSEQVVTTAAWIQDMYNKKYLIYTGKQRDWGGVETAFANGKIAFVISSSGDASDVVTAAKGNKITVVGGHMPYNAKTGWKGNLIGGASLWLINDLDPKVEEGALTWMLFLTNTKNAAEWHKASGYVPIRQSAAKLLEDAGWFKDNPVFAVAGDQLANSPVGVNTAGALMGTFLDTRDLVTQAVENLMLKGGDPAATFKDVKKKADDLLKKYNSLYGG